MSPTFRRHFLLGVISTALVTVLCIGAYEFYRNYKYNLWRSEYRVHHSLGDRLTIPSKNSILMWEYRPNSEHQNQKFKTNKFGFRQSNNISQEKPKNIVRFAFIGDSVTLGLFVESEENFVSQVSRVAENELSFFNLETLNFGVAGYNAIQIEELLKEKVVPFRSDHVIYVMCLNDFDFEDASAQLIRFFKKPDSFFLHDLGKIYRRIFHFGEDYHQYYFDKNKKLVFQSILNMKKIVNAEGFKFSVVVLPIFRRTMIIDLFGSRKIRLDSFENYPLVGVHKAIVETLRANNVTVFDLLEKFRDQAKPPSFFGLDAWHPNANGHRFIANSIVKLFIAPLAR